MNHDVYHIQYKGLLWICCTKAFFGSAARPAVVSIRHCWACGARVILADWISCYNSSLLIRLTYQGLCCKAAIWIWESLCTSTCGQLHDSSLLIVAPINNVASCKDAIGKLESLRGQYGRFDLRAYVWLRGVQMSFCNSDPIGVTVLCCR